jgi:hypothetical protein
MKIQNKELNLNSVYFFLSKKENKLTNKKENAYKLVINDFFVINEIEIVKRIHVIIYYKTHFHVFNKISYTNISLFEHESAFPVSKQILRDDKHILLEFGTEEVIYLKEYLKALSSPRIYIYNIIEIYRHLLRSINLLVHHNIVHNHICFESIVMQKMAYSDSYSYALITDFSLSINIAKASMNINGSDYMKHFIIEFNSSYLEWPMEFHILAYLLTNKLDSLSSYNIHTIIDEVINNHSILKTFGPSIVSSYKEEALQYYQKYINVSYTDILTDILQYSNTWDNYALSIMYLRILIGLHKSIKKDNKFIILFMKLLVTNIHVNPLKRGSIDSTTNKFESIVDSLDIKVYKQLIDLMSAR